MKRPSKKSLLWVGAGLSLLVLILIGMRDTPKLVDSALAERGYFQLVVE